MPLTRRELDTGWRVRRVGPAVPLVVGNHLAPDAADGPADEISVAATVPGCVHTDLLAAGVVADPYLDGNEAALRWIGESDWEYSTTFAWEATRIRDGVDVVDLVFDGLDTVAEIRLNGAALGHTANMHRTYRFGIGDVIRSGDNHLAVRFAAPLTEVARRAASSEPFPHANVYPEAFNLIRKMACNFGWDWGPQLTTVGIWRSVRLEHWQGVRWQAVRPHATVDGSTGRVSIDVEIVRSARRARAVRAVAEIGGHTAEALIEPDQNGTSLVIDVPEVTRWWPDSHGDPHTYVLTVTLGDPGEDDPDPDLVDRSDAADRWQRRIGFRSVHIDTSEDEIGSRWRLVVNDVPIWVRGANWIPDDCFPSRVDGDRYRQRITQAIDANIDLLRVWGGGIYEDDAFYALCDELGVMVWQDFLFACAAYPETPEMVAEVEAEARDAITRLMPHPSLVLWNGNNENLWGHEDWGWKEILGARPWGAGYYFDLLPALVAELDPTRPYWPGSPWSGPDRHPNDPHWGPTHIWDVWNERDYTEYRRTVPRFAAEFGYQAPPVFATLRRAISDDPLTPDSPGMQHHQKACDGAAKLIRGLVAHFGEPAGAEGVAAGGWTLDDWHYLAQVNQARAITLAVEHFRAHHTICSGSIVWQLNDCWPVTSWAVIDGDGRRKPLWYALRRAYADRLVTVQPSKDGLRVVAVNETDEVWDDTVAIRRVDAEGMVLADDRWSATVPPRSAGSWDLPALLANPTDATRELLDVAMGALRTTWFWVRDRNFAYPPAGYLWSMITAGTGVTLTVTAETLLRDLCLFPDRLDPAAFVDDLLVTLLPGETHSFEVNGLAPGTDPNPLPFRPVLRTVNDIPGLGAR